MTTALRALSASLILLTASFAQGNKSTDASQDKGTDATQSFVSPLGLGTGATLAVSQKGTTAAAAVERQLLSPINFWQVGVSGTTDKNGQATVYSSRDADAPGFKAKIGFGRSSFIKTWEEYTGSGGGFKRQAWCRDITEAINATLPQPSTISANANCAGAVALVASAMPPPPAPIERGAKPEWKFQGVADLLKKLAQISRELTQDQQDQVCKSLKDDKTYYKFCPDSGEKMPSVEDQHKKYPALYHTVTGQPEGLQWKISASWAPTLTSVPYRLVTNGVADLATKQTWTKLLNTGVVDAALYYGRFAFGVEGGYGETILVKTQNICNNTVAGTYTAQLCDTASLGTPNPTNTWLGSGTLAIYPLPLFSKEGVMNPGVQVQFNYEAPTTGGHHTVFSVPFYFAPASSPLAFVYGIQPTWDRNTDPRIGNKFYVSLFVGARPSITK